ncbi:MAG: ArnT family glycosyltransferase [Saprospiraceae bacterium]
MPLKLIAWRIILLLAAAKLLFHLFTNVNYGFHRDEMLYLALGRHLDFGYWSNPPLVGWIAAFIQAVLGDSMFAVRLIPSLFSTGILILTCLMAREMGGGRYAQLLAGLSILLTISFTRSGWLFQPVGVDMFFWTLFCYLVLRYLNTENPRYLLGFGVAFGFGFLNKYLVLFFLLALLIGLLLTPHRRVLWSKYTLGAVLIAAIIILPNFIWQYQYGFPVVTHMRELSETQLANVQYADFLLDQVLANLPIAIIWVGGLIYLLLYKKSKPYRLLAYIFITTIVLFLLLKGKSYYTLGIYPVMIGAGGVYFEKILQPIWLKVALPILIAALFFPLLPLGVPYLSIPKMVAYCNNLRENWGIDGATRWEDGEIHPLPQDYADMLGWEELAQHVTNAYARVPDKSRCLIYCENYGQAGAVELFAKNLPPVNSFNDSYRLWIQEDTNADVLIYVNDELGEDVQALFADIQMIGKIENAYARERGTTVYLCQQPRQPFGSLWKRRVQEVLGK